MVKARSPAFAVHIRKLFDLSFKVLYFLNIFHFFKLKCLLFSTDLDLISLHQRVHSHLVFLLNMLSFLAEVSVLISLILEFKLVLLHLLRLAFECKGTVFGQRTYMADIQ